MKKKTKRKTKKQTNIKLKTTTKQNENRSINQMNISKFNNNTVQCEKQSE